MATIKIDISDLTELKRALLKIKGDAESYYNEVTKIANELNMKIRAKQDIDDMLLHIKNNLQKEIKYLDCLATMIDECINEFVANEKIEKLPDYWVSANMMSDSRVVGGVSDLITEKRLHDVSDLTKLLVENESNASVLKLSDYDGLAKYFSSK